MDSNVAQQLVQSFADFLRSQLEDKVLSEESSESVEVALQCLEQAYSLPPPIYSPIDLYTVFEKHLHPNGSSSSCPSDDDRKEADKFKNEGNDALRTGNYQEALNLYEKAISLDSSNAVYYSNAAAAHTKMGNHREAIEECKKALNVDPNYSKAFGRMGLAHSELGDHHEAAACFKLALELDPGNEGYQSNLAIAEERAGGQPAPNPFASMMGASAAGGLGGLAGGPGGMPDLGSLLANPALMNMAQTLMADPNMQNMMSNVLGGAMGGQAAPAPSEGNTAESPAAGGNTEALSGLMQAGRQLAEQMQTQHPDLLEQLKSQFGNNQPQPPQ